MQLIIALFLTLFLNQITIAQIDTIPLHCGQYFRVASKFTNDTFSVYVRLPEDLATAKDSCALLILLDGDEYFKIATDVLSLYEYDKKTKPTIVIALPSTAELRWKYYTPTHVPYGDKWRQDSLLQSTTGNFDNYASFIEKELIPKLSIFYNVKFDDKTIFGHSLGGLGALSFFKFRPNIFNKYIIASPSTNWDGFLLAKYYRDQLPMNSVTKSKLFISVASNDIRTYKENISVLAKSLQSKYKDGNKHFFYKEYLNVGHNTTGLLSLIDGLNLINK